MKDSFSDYRYFKALGHPIRLEIVKMLSGQGELCVCKIFEAFDISQPGISKQLAVLKKLGVINGRRSGTWIYYSINESCLKTLLSTTRDIKQNIKRSWK